MALYRCLFFLSFFLKIGHQQVRRSDVVYYIFPSTGRDQYVVVVSPSTATRVEINQSNPDFKEGGEKKGRNKREKNWPDKRFRSIGNRCISDWAKSKRTSYTLGARLRERDVFPSSNLSYLFFTPRTAAAVSVAPPLSSSSFPCAWQD